LAKAGVFQGLGDGWVRIKETLQDLRLHQVQVQEMFG
jgi:lipoate synthase